MPIQRIQFRRGAAADWTSVNPVLASGEPGFEQDTGLFKLGNAVDAWNDLDYAGGGGGGGGGPVSADDITDATVTGRALIRAASAAAGRAAIAAAADTHTHAAADISDSGATGRTLLAAASAASARTTLSVPSTSEAVLSAAATSSGLSRNTGAATWLTELMSGATRVYGISGTDGRPTRNGQALRVERAWYSGDPDPVSPFAWEHFTCYLGVGETVPAWALAREGTSIVQDLGGGSSLTYDIKAKFAGIADGTTVTVGTEGSETGATPVDYIFAAAAPVVEATTATIGEASISRSLVYSQTATSLAIGWDIPAGTERRASFLLKTPTTFPTALVIAAFKNGIGAGSDAARLILGASGSIRISNSANVNALSSSTGRVAANTWYRVEFWIKQNATAANGLTRAIIYDMTGTVVYDSQDVEDPAGTGFGTTHNRFYLGNVGTAVTADWQMAELGVTDDADTVIGRVA